MRNVILIIVAVAAAVLLYLFLEPASEPAGPAAEACLTSVPRPVQRATPG